MKLKVKNRYLEINKRPTFIYSGEIHYFRIPKNFWKKHLEIAKISGLNTVSSYIPWIWHEYEEGKFDFTGKTIPERDLLGFIDLVEDAGLFFIPRIGPVSNAELLNEGLPGWLIKKYPEVVQQEKGVINLPHTNLVSYLNPVFLKFARRWYDQVLPLLKPKTIDKGGNIILLQVCNEIGMSHWVNKTADYSKVATQLYQEYLKKKYKLIENLNLTYRTNYADWQEISQPDGNISEKNFIVYYDWSSFYRSYFKEYFQTLLKHIRSRGIYLPVIVNVPQFYDYDIRGRGFYAPLTSSFYREFFRTKEPVIFGGAYQPRRIDYDNFPDIFIATESIRTITGDSPIICAELQTGIMRDRPKLTPEDVDLLLKTTAASGVNGINCYMFSGGKNPAGIGMFGTYHSWQAPIDYNGKIKPHWKEVKDFGNFVKKFGNILVQTEPSPDCTFGFYYPYFITEYCKSAYAEDLNGKVRQFLVDGILRLLQLNNISYEFCDLLKKSPEELKNVKYLLVFSLGRMDKDTQIKLVNYVQSGGNLILFPRLPGKDLTGKEEDFLAQQLGIKEVEKVKERVVFVDEKECYVPEEVSVIKSDGEVIAQTLTGKTTGVVKNSGRGQVLFLGFSLTHIYDYHIEIVKKIVEKIGLKPSLEIVPGDLVVTRRLGKEYCFLFVFNFNETSRLVQKISVNISGKERRITSLEGKKISPRSGIVLLLHLKKETIINCLT